MPSTTEPPSRPQTRESDNETDHRLFLRYECPSDPVGLSADALASLGTVVYRFCARIPLTMGDYRRSAEILRLGPVGLLCGAPSLRVVSLVFLQEVSLSA